MARVLVADDSAVARDVLGHILGSDPALEVIGSVVDGQAAVEAVARLKPDVVTMDINMPVLNGFQATRQIMETCPTPIVMVSASWNTAELATSFNALEAGALAVLPRPPGMEHPNYQAAAAELIQTVKLMAEIKVVRRWKRAVAPARSAAPVIPARPAGAVQVVAIGVSTGGPPVLRTILSELAPDFPAPVLIVQHMVAGFVQGFADWLTQVTKFPVHLATHGGWLLPGHAYLAPDGFHLGVMSARRLALSEAPPQNGLRPSASYLFRSVSEVFGAEAVGVVLTGMGKDGVQELKLMRERGAITIAQSEESSVIHGMPGEAIKLGAAMHVLSPEAIAEALNLWLKKPEGAQKK